jgi:adenylylsulfate kinase
MMIQFCGLSGSGKTTLAESAKQYFQDLGIKIEVLDGDVYRNGLCSDLGYSQEDRKTNIRRLAFVASRFSNYDIIPIICAINPYESIRQEISSTFPNTKTVYIKCSIEELIKRDTKGMYSRALLPDDNEKKLKNLSGINDPFEEPGSPDLVLETDKLSISESTQRLVNFIKSHILY